MLIATYMVFGKLKNFNIAKIAESGQIFRFYKNKSESLDSLFVYDLYVLDKHLRIETYDFNNYSFSCSQSEYNKFYKNYFSIDFNSEKVLNVVNKSDNYLKKSIEYGIGIRILKQDPYEMLISFIISQRKSIPAIRTSIERLCKYCGKKKKDKYGEYYAFPKAEEILKNKSKLSKCGLGYRVPYIIDACEKIVSGEIVLYNNKYMSAEYLMNIKGVGIKVASCVMLFAYGDLTCVPEDVWMKRVLEKHYKDGLPKKYKKYAGVIQQYLFNYAKDFGV